MSAAVATDRRVLTVSDLHVYKTDYDRRHNDSPAGWARSGARWAIAAPSGAVLVYNDGYPSLELLEDCVYVLNNC